MTHALHRRAFLGALLLPPLVLPIAARAQSRAAAALAPKPLTAQDRADLARITANMDGLRSFKARFLQVAPDGGTSEGTAWLQRPGKMRFEYDKPSPYLLLAGFGSAVFFDSQLKQTTSVPLSSTPLGILLADRITLNGDVTVTNISRDPGQIQVTVVRTSSPGDGSLTLVYADNPLALRQWAVVDAQRQETRVSLFNLEPGGTFPDSLFQFTDPRFQQHSPN